MIYNTIQRKQLLPLSDQVHETFYYYNYCKQKQINKYVLFQSICENIYISKTDT